MAVKKKKTVLTYFSFYPSEYLSKDICFCSMSAQGVFINIVCLYVQREGQLKVSQIKRRFAEYTKELEELYEEQVIKKDGEKIVIRFLDDQITEIKALLHKRSEDGKRGGRPMGSFQESKPPKLEDFRNHALEISGEVDLNIVKQKYDTWVDNGWRDGYDNPIKNWKLKIQNNIKYWHSDQNEKPIKEDSEIESANEVTYGN